MNQLRAGFARVNITPAMGTPLAGYAQHRPADGVLDELEANALALSLGDTKLILMVLDNAGLFQSVVTPMREHVSRVTGLPLEHVFIACTHTHTGPDLNKSIDPKPQAVYKDFLTSRLGDAASFAIADLKPARMGWAVGQAPNIAFVRRFRMKDGSIRTNPGANNPDILHPLGEVDERVGVLRFDREGAPGIVVAHFGNHPDTVGGCKVSADWPGFARRMVEKSIDNTVCMVFNGAEGDINHCNTAPDQGYLNDLANDFDDCMRGYGHTRHMGMVIAGAVMQVFSKVRWIPVRHLAAMQRVIHHPSNMPAPEELPQARDIWAMHTAGRSNELPYQGMMLTTIIYEAERMLNLEHGPESFALNLSAIVIGDIAFFGIPGEAFLQVGLALKNAPDYQLVLPCVCANGYEGYFPTMDAYKEGGYEARSSYFKAGVAEAIVDAGLYMLCQLYRQTREE